MGLFRGPSTGIEYKMDKAVSYAAGRLLYDADVPVADGDVERRPHVPVHAADAHLVA